MSLLGSGLFIQPDVVLKLKVGGEKLASVLFHFLSAGAPWCAHICVCVRVSLIVWHADLRRLSDSSESLPRCDNPLHQTGVGQQAVTYRVRRRLVNRVVHHPR